MNELVKAVAKAMMERFQFIAGPQLKADPVYWEEMAKFAIAAMKDLPSEPGPRYTAGEYSRRNIEAMVDDALQRSP